MRMGSCTFRESLIPYFHPTASNFFRIVTDYECRYSGENTFGELFDEVE